jgi:hypothetical protein
LPLSRQALLEYIVSMRFQNRLIFGSAAALLAAAPLPAQTTMDHSMHDMSQMSGMHDMSGHSMRGMFGPYAMTRESSGTAWQPESTPMMGEHFMLGDWTLMVHGFAYAIYDHQGSDRGADKTISTNMLMLMAQRQLGPGTFAVRTMFSLEPLTIGKTGYPLLFQTGETANNRTPLIDRQHPHDLFMELATSYSLPINDTDAAFVYLGMPGEPALGPATFMHRFSGMDNPEAPITHHWLDSTHITFGVLTLGYVWNDVKIEGSLFTGREPDEQRWNMDDPKFDSQSARLTYNFTPDFSAQISYGHINSPEQLEPEVDQNRITASITYNRRFGRQSNWQTTVAYGQDDNNPGNRTNAWLLESAINFEKTHTIFARYENVEKDELFLEDEPLADRIFTVNKVSVGYIYDFPEAHRLQFGVGALGSIHFIPDDLEAVYGETPLSGMVFARVRF